MKVMSYNVWDGGCSESSGDRRDHVVRVIQAERPDVLGLVEACGFETQLAWWQDALGMEGTVVQADTGFHVALFVRPPLHIQAVEPVPTRAFYHACLHARVALPKGELHVLVAHLSPFDPDWRLSEARHLAREAHDDRPVLVMGDFNALSPDDDLTAAMAKLPRRILSRHVVRAPVGGQAPEFDTRAMALLRWSGFEDVWQRLHDPADGWTMPTAAGRKNLPRVRFDYILATRPLARRVRDCRVIRSPDAEQGSDHFPIVAVFDS